MMNPSRSQWLIGFTLAFSLHLLMLVILVLDLAVPDTVTAANPAPSGITIGLYPDWGEPTAPAIQAGLAETFTAGSRDAEAATMLMPELQPINAPVTALAPSTDSDAVVFDRVESVLPDTLPADSLSTDYPVQVAETESVDVLGRFFPDIAELSSETVTLTPETLAGAVSIVERAAPEAPAAELGPPEVTAAEPGPPEVTAAEPGPPEATPAEPGPPEATAAEPAAPDVVAAAALVFELAAWEVATAEVPSADVSPMEMVVSGERPVELSTAVVLPKMPSEAVAHPEGVREASISSPEVAALAEASAELIAAVLVEFPVRVQLEALGETSALASQTDTFADPGTTESLRVEAFVFPAEAVEEEFAQVQALELADAIEDESAQLQALELADAIEDESAQVQALELADAIEDESAQVQAFERAEAIEEESAWVEAVEFGEATVAESALPKDSMLATAHAELSSEAVAGTTAELAVDSVFGVSVVTGVPSIEVAVDSDPTVQVPAPEAPIAFFTVQIEASVQPDAQPDLPSELPSFPTLPLEFASVVVLAEALDLLEPEIGEAIDEVVDGPLLELFAALVPTIASPGPDIAGPALGAELYRAEPVDSEPAGQEPGGGLTSSHWYMAHLRQQFERTWNYPRQAQRRGEEGTVLLEFTVNRAGVVVGHVIRETSGSRLLDNTAEHMIRRIQPLPLPLEVGQDFLTITVPIEFRLVR